MQWKINNQFLLKTLFVDEIEKQKIFGKETRIWFILTILPFQTKEILRNLGKNAHHRRLCSFNQNFRDYLMASYNVKFSESETY